MSHTFTPGETPSLGKRKERAGGCSALDSHLFYSHMGRGKKEGLEFFEIAKQQESTAKHILQPDGVYF